VINYPAGGPYENAFSTGNDGNLYYRYFDGSGWQSWVNLGAPAGTHLYGDPAVINYPSPDGPFENAFVTGDDGNLYYTWFDGGSWQGWVNLGHPFGTLIQTDPAVINYPSTGPYENVFVTGNDGYLFYRYFDGSAWQGWISLGKPLSVAGVGGDPAVINYPTPDGPYQNVFVTGSDSGLYYTWFDGSSWQGWVNLGHPAGTLVGNDNPGVINYGNGFQNAFITATDGNLYYTWFNGSSWQGWVNLGHPAGATLPSDPAVINYPNPDGPFENAFVTGSDNNLYYTWFDGSSWQGWVNLGHPAAVGSLSDPGVINYGGPYENAFVNGSDGNLYYTWFDGASWQGWVNLGSPNPGYGPSGGGGSSPGSSEKGVPPPALPESQELLQVSAEAARWQQVILSASRKHWSRNSVLLVQDSEAAFLAQLGRLQTAEIDDMLTGALLEDR
jgi:hypothetical protein